VAHRAALPIDVQLSDFDDDTDLLQGRRGVVLAGGIAAAVGVPALDLVEPHSVLARSGLGSSDRLLPRRDRHLAPAARRPFP